MQRVQPSPARTLCSAPGRPTHKRRLPLAGGFVSPIFFIFQGSCHIPILQGWKRIDAKSCPLKFSTFNIAFKMFLVDLHLMEKLFPNGKLCISHIFCRSCPSVSQTLFYFWISRNFLIIRNQGPYVLGGG